MLIMGLAFLPNKLLNIPDEAPAKDKHFLLHEAVHVVVKWKIFMGELRNYLLFIKDEVKA